MSSYDCGAIAIGANVDIQRTDGRVHSAVISGVNADNQSVTVEWFERGEAKGKEIEFEAIYQLNPGMRSEASRGTETSSVTASYVKPSPPRPNHTPAPSGQPQATSRNAPAPTPVLTHSNSRIGRPRVTAAGPPAPSAGTKQPTAPTPAPQVMPPPSQPQAPALAPAPVSAPPPMLNSPQPDDLMDDSDDVDTQPVSAPVANGRPAGLGPGGPEFKKPAVRAAGGGVGGGGGPGPVPGPGAGRKSNCVKEIERIQQRREERRAAQRAVKEQPDYDPSNPCYDFIMMIREHQDKLDYRPITNTDAIDDHQICVCVRKRPLNKKELGRKEVDVITVPNKENVIVHEPKTKVDLTKYLENQQFRFDYAFDETADNAIVYRYTAKPLVEGIFERGMATCFAYGQTGSGKTHTMGGEFQGKGQQDCSNGIYALAARDVFRLLSTKYKSDNLYVDAAFFEIYSGKVFDLLNRKEKLRVLEDAKSQVQIVGLKEEPIESVDDVLRLLQHGNHIRTSGQTSANQHSSRSHAVFQMILKKRPSGKLHGKFSLIDLAGNERGADTSSSDRITRMEGAEINKSLLALKECIRALGRKGAHLPFRASKLTQVLRDSFIGDRSRTCMIAMISPGMSCCEHTLNTLRYADRVKELGVVGGPGGANDGAPMLEPGDGNVRVGDFGATTEAIDYQGESLFMEDDDDLAMLRSANEGEVTDELFTFHEVVNHMERTEEEVCDDHKVVCDHLGEWSKEHNRLLKLSNQVDYDVDDYSARLEQLLSSQIALLSNLKDKVANWRVELKQEEEMSSKLQNKRK